jgi:Ca2+-transporting ATPase
MRSFASSGYVLSVTAETLPRNEHQHRSGRAWRVDVVIVAPLSKEHTVTTQIEQSSEWYCLPIGDVARRLETGIDTGLTTTEVEARLSEYGPNSIPKEQPPSTWSIALRQIREPMNLMLIVVTVLSFIIGQTSTAILIGFLVLLNVWMATSQALKARASVDALDELQVPSARVVRDGRVESIDSLGLVPGDVVTVEAGDLVPADGRIVTSATLEVQEAALTGESAPVPKDADDLDEPDTALGDRSNMLFQNTSVTRGTATMIVTATGSNTEMGKIAGMLQGVARKPSPLERELGELTKWLGIVAWVSVAIIFVVGLFRGLDANTLILLCVLTAISAIPSGLPTFVQIMLSSGAQRLAQAKAVVKSLNDVETLGSTSAINSDKTGTLTMNEMTAVSMFTGGRWYKIEGSGYDKTGAILHAADDEIPDFTALGYGLTLCSDAVVEDDGTVIGDPTEAALVVLAAKLGVDAEISRAELPRLAEVPFDSAYKFMATFHRVPEWDEEPVIELVKGGPDVLLSRSSSAMWHGQIVPIERVRDEIVDANRQLSEKGLRVLSFAVRRYPESAVPEIQLDPMEQVADLVFISLVGIIDPLRPSAKVAVETARRAGIDVRMITGDHTITARAIADDLGLGSGVITGKEFDALTDEELTKQVPDLHVFGRVSPQNKLRLVDSMQATGQVVAMTGDAVNDAAALKKADIGVAMGSGSEVSKQAAKMILTDDNFSTLVHAVELGRDIYDKVKAYIGYQLSGMFGLLALMLMATIFNVNQGVALSPGMLIYVSLFVAVFPVIAIMTDEPDPDLMLREPRDPKVPVFNRTTGIRWITVGLLLGICGLIPLVWGPDEPQIDAPSVSMTMTYAVTALATVGLGVVNRRDPGPFWQGPAFPFFMWLSIPAVVTWLGVELPLLQRWLDTTSLTGSQWLAVFALALAVPFIVEIEKAYRRHRAQTRQQQARTSVGSRA